MDAKTILEQAVANGASDIFIVAGLPVSCRKNGVINRIYEDRLLPPDTESLLVEIYRLADNRDISQLHKHGDDDFSFAIQGVSRFRVSAYKQRGALSAVIRVITFTLPDPKELGLPDYIIQLGSSGKGMVLVTGPAGSGKSTTLACIIDQINKTRDEHIITLEDPLEFLHRHNRSIVSQREINVDTDNYVTALRACAPPKPRCDPAWGNARLRDDQRCHDRRRDRASALLYSAHHRRREYHRPYYRCISVESTEADRCAAFHGAQCRRVSAAGSYGGWKSSAGIRDNDRYTGDPEHDPG